MSDADDDRALLEAEGIVPPRPKPVRAPEPASDVLRVTVVIERGDGTELRFGAQAPKPEAVAETAAISSVLGLVARTVEDVHNELANGGAAGLRWSPIGRQ